jgi:hypothetical protein
MVSGNIFFFLQLTIIDDARVYYNSIAECLKIHFPFFHSDMKHTYFLYVTLGKKCNFDLMFFYTNETFLDRRLRDRKKKNKKIYIGHFVFLSIPASVGTVESEGRQMKQCWTLYGKKEKKSPKKILKKIFFCLLRFRWSAWVHSQINGKCVDLEQGATQKQEHL